MLPTPMDTLNYWSAVSSSAVHTWQTYLRPYEHSLSEILSSLQWNSAPEQQTSTDPQQASVKAIVEQHEKDLDTTTPPPKLSINPQSGSSPSPEKQHPSVDEKHFDVANFFNDWFQFDKIEDTQHTHYDTLLNSAFYCDDNSVEEATSLLLDGFTSFDDLSASAENQFDPSAPCSYNIQHDHQSELQHTSNAQNPPSETPSSMQDTNNPMEGIIGSSSPIEQSTNQSPIAQSSNQSPVVNAEASQSLEVPRLNVIDSSSAEKSDTQNQLCNVFSMNVMGAASTKQSFSAARRWVYSILSAMQLSNASIGLLQDLHVCERSTVHNQLITVFRQCGFQIFLRSFTDKMTKSNDPSINKTRGRGVAIILPIHLAEKVTIEPAEGQLEKEAAYGYFLACSFQATPNWKITAISAYSPPNHADIRKTINSDIEKIITDHQTAKESIIIIGSDSNSVYDPSIDSFSGDFKNHKACFIDLMKKLGCIDSFRLCNPNAIEYSRISSYLSNSSEIKSAKSRIDHIHIKISACNTFRIQAAAIDSISASKTGILSDHFPTLASISIADSEPFSYVEYEIESNKPEFNFKEFILDCQTADLCDPTHHNHPSSKIDWSVSESYWSKINSELSIIYSTAKSRGEVTATERKQIDDITASMSTLLSSIRRVSTPKNPNRTLTPFSKTNHKTHLISQFTPQKPPRSIAFAEAFRIRAQIQCLLCDLYAYHSNIRSYIDPLLNPSTIESTKFSPSPNQLPTKTVSHLINKYNSTINHIIDRTQELSSITTDDQARFDVFLQDNPKRAAKIKHLIPLNHKPLTTILAEFEVSSLESLPHLNDASSLLTLVKESIEFRKEQARILAAKSASTDEHQDRCNTCKVLDSEVTVVKCDSCPLVFHPECCNASENDGEWFCNICSMEADLIVDLSSTITHNESETNQDRVDQLWAKSYLISKQRVSYTINKAVKQLNTFYHNQSLMDRLMLLSENSIGKWYARVFPKHREQPDPLFRDPETGLPLKNRKERLDSTAELHRKFSSAQGHPNAFAKEHTDISGRTMVSWVHQEIEFESRLSEISNQYRSEGISEDVIEEISKAERFIYHNLKPNSAQRQWSPTGTSLPPNWPNHPLSESEKDSILKGKINKQRVNSFLYPAIKWFPKEIQDTFWTLLNICIEFCVTPHSTKLFLRLAIPKKTLGDFRHLAIPDDLFSVIAITINNRISSIMNQVCSDQICSFLQGRSPMDANAKRSSVREDAFQALQEGHDHPLFITMTDDMKMYDSVTRTLLATACMVMGAPEGLLKLLCENMHDNHFFVHTTEGRTSIASMEIGLRQGDVKACFAANLVNQTRIIMLSIYDTIYHLKYPPPTTSLSIHELGFFYCDDQEQYAGSLEKVITTIQVLGFFSLAFKMGIHGLPKSSILYISKHTHPKSLPLYAWDRSERAPRKKQIAVQPITQDSGSIIGSSLGYVVSTGIDTSSVQSQHVIKRVMSSANRISAIKMKLTAFERTMVCMAVGRGAIGYDPISGLTDQDARSCAMRFINLMARSYGMGYADRKGYITAPLSLGGAATPHLMGEWLLFLQREVSFYLNHNSIAAALRQCRFTQAYSLADKTISIAAEDRPLEINIIKQRALTLAQNGIIIRDYYNPISARLLDHMTHEDVYQRGVYNWTNGKSAPAATIQKALKWYEFSNISVHLRRCMHQVYDQDLAISALKDAFENVEDGLGSILSAREQQQMLKLLPKVFEDITQEWNTLRFSIKVNVGLGEEIIWSEETIISAPIPRNLITHSTEGLINIDRTRKAQSEQIARLFPSINLEQCDIFTDGSLLQGNAAGYAAIFAIPQIAQNSSRVIACISAQSPQAMGWHKVSNNFGELSAIITAAELIRHRSQVSIYTDSMISIHNLSNANTKKARHQSRSPFFYLTARSTSIINRYSENKLDNTTDPSVSLADEDSSVNFRALQDLKNTSPNLRFSLKDSSPIAFIHVPSHQQSETHDPCSAVVKLNELADKEAYQAASITKLLLSSNCKSQLNHIIGGHRYSTTVNGSCIDNCAASVIREITSRMSAYKLTTNVKAYRINTIHTSNETDNLDITSDTDPDPPTQQNSPRLQRTAHKPAGFYIDPDPPPAPMTDSSTKINQPNCDSSERPYHNHRTFQGNLAKALSNSAGFNMVSKQSHIINTHRWYVARLHTRQIRTDQKLHHDYTKVISQMGVINRHLSQLKIEDPAEICPLCITSEDARRGCQRHIMTECKALLESRKKILFHPIERAFQELIDSGIISSTSIQHPIISLFTPDQELAAEFPNLANLRFLIPCYDQDGFVPTDDNIPTEMYSYCGIISISMVTAIYTHISPCHSSRDLNREMRSIQQRTCKQIERFHDIAVAALQLEYNIIRKKSASISPTSAMNVQITEHQSIRSVKPRKRRRQNNRSGHGSGPKRLKKHHTDTQDMGTLCTHKYCDIAAAAGLNRNTTSADGEPCDKCSKLQWIDRAVKETFIKCCAEHPFCASFQNRIKPDGFDSKRFSFSTDFVSIKPTDKNWCKAVFQNVAAHLSSNISSPRFLHHCICPASTMRSLFNKSRSCCLKCLGILPMSHNHHYEQSAKLCTRCLPIHAREDQAQTNIISFCSRCLLLSTAAELSRHQASSITVDQLSFQNSVTFHRGNTDTIDNIWNQIADWCSNPNQPKWYDCIQFIMNAQWPPASSHDHCLAFDNVWGTGSDIPSSPTNLSSILTESMIDSSVLLSAIRILSAKESCFNSRGTQFSILSPLAAEEWCTQPAHFIPGNRSQHTFFNAITNPISSLKYCKFLFVPFSVFNMHWIIFRIDYRAKEVIIFDPLHDQNHQQAEIIMEIWINLADFIHKVSTQDDITAAKYNTVKSWPSAFAHDIQEIATSLPKQQLHSSPTLGCAIHCIVFLVNSIREVHTPLNDLQAFKLRHLIKFIIETATLTRCARQSTEQTAQSSTSISSSTRIVRDEAWQDEFCSGCGQASSTRNGDLIACDAPHCSHVYHFACVNIKSTPIPDKWFCPYCK